MSKFSSEDCLFITEHSARRLKVELKDLAEAPAICYRRQRGLVSYICIERNAHPGGETNEFCSAVGVQYNAGGIGKQSQKFVSFKVVFLKIFI